MKMSAKKVLIYGGKGALGSAVVKCFNKANWVSNGTLLIHVTFATFHRNSSLYLAIQ